MSTTHTNVTELLSDIDSRFVSGNSVPVERAYISATEWHELRQEAARLDWIHRAFNNMKTSSSENFVSLLRLDIDPITGDLRQGVDAKILRESAVTD